MQSTAKVSYIVEYLKELCTEITYFLQKLSQFCYKKGENETIVE